MYVLTQHAKHLSENEIHSITRDALIHASEFYDHVVYLPLVNFNGESLLQRNFSNKLVLRARTQRCKVDARRPDWNLQILF
jgi:hypothetical protein